MNAPQIIMKQFLWRYQQTITLLDWLDYNNKHNQVTIINDDSGYRKLELFAQKLEKNRLTTLEVKTQ